MINADLGPLLADALSPGRGVGLEDLGNVGQHRQVLHFAGGDRIADPISPHRILDRHGIPFHQRQVLTVAKYGQRA